MGAAGNRKTIFITGGASGIGAATAKHFVKNGWFAGLYDIDAEKLAQTAAEIGADNCVSGRLDVRDRAEWTAALNHFAEATDGRMDVLVNNAGLARVGG
ncbi:MAG: SDR family NAD(P)-dependent oxidoreductase, partial [Pseudomonadota bacterium]